LLPRTCGEASPGWERPRGCRAGGCYRARQGTLVVALRKSLERLVTAAPVIRLLLGP